MITKLFGLDKESTQFTNTMSSIDNQATPDRMDYQRTREQQELERQLNFSPNISLDLTPTQGDNCSGIADMTTK
jgi:hypothetical protein